jgi:hypothetical protein
LEKQKEDKMSDFLTSRVVNGFHRTATRQVPTDLRMTTDFRHIRLRDLVMVLVPKACKYSWACYTTAKLKRTGQILFRDMGDQASDVVDITLVRSILQDTATFFYPSVHDPTFIESVRPSVECLVLAWTLAGKKGTFPTSIELSPKSMTKMSAELLGLAEPR